MIGKHQNDQVFTQEHLVFSRGEYSESNEFLGANEDNVANLRNLEDALKRSTTIGITIGMERNVIF
jgi:hypothetical protein